MTIARKQDVYNIRLPKISAASAGMVSERRARQTTPRSNSVCLERPSKVLPEYSLHPSPFLSRLLDVCLLLLHARPPAVNSRFEPLRRLRAEAPARPVAHDFQMRMASEPM